MNNKLRKAIAGVLSTSMLLTSTVITPTNTVSAEATINYGDALALSLYFYDANQCGSEVDDNCLTWRGNCHTYDETASLDNAKGLTSTEKEFIKNANGGSNTVDVSGGYHDAGDHLKFSMTMAFSSTNLAWAYNQYPEAFEETGSKDHLFDILKEMCDYFMKVTYLDDSDEVVAFCYMVGGDQDHNEWSAPETQTMDRPTYWATASNNSTDAACQMAAALASASMALKEVDQDYANECLKYANALQKFGSTYKNANYDGIGSYYSSGSQNDDVAWGDLWCHLASGTIDSYTPITPQNGVYNGEYDCWIYSWDKVWGGYSTLLSQLGFGDAFSNELKFEMDGQTTDYSSNYFTIGGGWGASRYNCAWQMYAMEYANATGNDQFYEYAKKNMDYLLGNNSSNTSYLLGYGDSWPVHIHHRAANSSADVSQNPSATYTVYGALIGGPTGENGQYEDKADQYSFTEPALDYNGSFIMAIAGLYDKYGDGTDKLNTIITSATEIDETFEFGSWYDDIIVEPIPTETTTDDIDGPGGLITVDGTITAIDESNNTVTIEVEENGEKFSTVVDISSGHFLSNGNYSVGDAVEVKGFATNIAHDPDWWFENASFTVKSTEDTTIDTTTEDTTINTTQDTTTEDSTINTTQDTTTEDITINTTQDTTITNEYLGGEGETGSTTEETTITDEPIGILGDVNDDGEVQSNDLVLVKKYVLQIIDDTKLNIKNADVNQDGEVDAIDILYIKKFVLQIITEF